MLVRCANTQTLPALHFSWPACLVACLPSGLPLSVYLSAVHLGRRWVWVQVEPQAEPRGRAAEGLLLGELLGLAEPIAVEALGARGLA